MHIAQDSKIAFSIRGGNDADKPSDPKIFDCWLAEDTRWLYICFANGQWTRYGKEIMGGSTGVRTMISVVNTPVYIA